MVNVTVTFRRDLTDVSVHDDIKGDWCSDNVGLLLDRNFKNGDTAKFSCQREGDAPYSARISIAGKVKGESISEDYVLEDNENSIDFPSIVPKFVEEFQKYANFKEFAEDVVRTGWVPPN